MMVGLPGETDADIDELVRFSARAVADRAAVALGVAPFVAKRNTPLDGAPFAGIDVRRAPSWRACARGLRGRASRCGRRRARWAWVEYVLAQGGMEAGRRALAAHARAAASPTGSARSPTAARRRTELRVVE